MKKMTAQHNINGSVDIMVNDIITVNCNPMGLFFYLYLSRF